MHRSVVGPAVCLAAVIASTLGAQEHRDPVNDSAQLVPGAHYRAGWLHRRLLGQHYRDLWTQPVKVEVLDLERLAGGLTPLCLSGEFQTTSLRLRGADGRQYVFRSADKDPTRALLTARLRRTPAANILQDQISSHHPAGALVVAPLLAAVGVLHAEPQLRVMPDHPALQDFRQPFAGTLGTVEVRPEAGFGASNGVEETEHVWNRIEASFTDRVDARAYLAARLIDILVGDWDRNFDQWAWASYETDHGRTWRPIPRNRDQAFARLDGLVLSLARYYWPQLVSFKASYPSMYGLTWSGRALDRRFLVALEKPVWDSVAQAVQHQITDSILEGAVRQLPRTMGEAHGAGLLFALKRRRDHLLEAAEEFYPLIAKYAELRGTNQNDVALIERLDDTRVRVRISSAAAPEAAYFERTFTMSETREIRLDLAGGDDRAIVRGSVLRSATVRVVGGEGNDVAIDSSTVGLPIVRRLLTRTFFYDSDGDNQFVRGPGTEIDERHFQPPARKDIYPPSPPGACGDTRSELPPRDLGDPVRDWGTHWVPAPKFGFQPDLGPLIGMGVVRYRYAFHKVPYGSRVSLGAVFATGPGRLRVAYEGDFRNLPRRAWASLSLRYSGIDLVRFHGFGNETVLDQPKSFYRVTLRQVSAATSLTVFPPNSRISLGPFFEYAQTELGQGGLIDSLRPYGTDRFAQSGIEGRFDVDTRDRTWAPRRGVHLSARGRIVPAVLDAASAYGLAEGEAATYLSVGNPARVTLAARLGGKRVWGTAPFHAAAYLGGATMLRGYNEQRFAGDAALFANGELRLFLTSFRLLLPGELGVHGLGDIGRVYLEGERSDRWHAAVGGGLWLAFIDRGSTVTLSIARSPERLAFYGRLGFMF